MHEVRMKKLKQSKRIKNNKSWGLSLIVWSESPLREEDT